MDRPKDILSSIYGVQVCDLMDREKVIKCLEACTGDSNDCAGHTCPYWDFEGDIGCRTQMELDALALLKKQNRHPVIICPHCGKRVK